MSYYNERLAVYGDDVRTLGWGSVESQQLRFKILIEIADLSGASVLDFGCGFGDLYPYLLQKYPDALYIGYDNNPEMLAIARKKYPNAHFVDRLERADYAVESGAFNLVQDWHEEAILMWELARKGIALNFTSNLAERQTDGIVYTDPFEAIKFCSQLSKRFVLRHDYKSNDFAICLYR